MTNIMSDFYQIVRSQNKRMVFLSSYHNVNSILLDERRVLVVFASVAFPLPAGRYITRMFFDVVVFAFVLKVVFYGRCFTRMFSE